MGIKNPHPPNESGVGYKSIPRFHPGYGQRPSLIGTVTGAPGAAFPLAQLRSGIVPGRVTAALHQNGILSGNLSGTACLHHSFFVQKIYHILYKMSIPREKVLFTTFKFYSIKHYTT